MSFRLRVLLLVVFLVAISTGATAWLTLRQASRQFSDDAAAGRCCWPRPRSVRPRS